MLQAKISSKYQIVIPKEAREEMKVSSGDKLIVKTLHGITLLIPKSKNAAGQLRGFSKGLYSKKYLDRERDSWDK